MTDRHTADSITSDALDQLYDQAEAAEKENAELRDALAHCHEREPRLRAEAALARVIELYEQWVKAGPPPLGTSMSRWWDRRLAELHAAIFHPAATQAAGAGHVITVEGNPAAAHEAVRQMDADTTHPHTGLVVQPYTDHGLHRWVFRCWGTDTCDGLLSLGHTSQQWAERARDRHVTEEHPSGQPAPVDTAHRYCILCGGQSQPAHTCDPAGLRTVYRGLADRADELETNNAALVRCAERAGVRRDQLAATLREVLAAYDATGCLSPAQHARWHAALEPAKEQH